MAQPDGELDLWLEQARSGDADAEHRFLVAARTILLRWAVVRTAALDEAEDLTQDALIKVRERWSQFEGRAQCTTWLYRVLQTTHLDRVRRRAARSRAESRAAGSVEGSSPCVRLENGLTDLVQRFLGALSERQREIVNLVDLEGYSPEDVAGMTGLSSSTVRVHLHRGRQALRTQIEEIWDHD